MNAATRSRINQANAAQSTGPKTSEGKQRASMNALNHGLTGQRLILQPEEHEAYRRLGHSLRAELRPRTAMETQLVQKILDCHTRLNRIAAIENNLLNLGLLENLKDDSSEPDEIDRMAAQTRSWLAQENSFERLGRYEARLSRQLLAYTKELERLQADRIEKASAQRSTAALSTRQPAESKMDSAPFASFGQMPKTPPDTDAITHQNPLREAA